ncbi:MAG: ArsC/Spx/MgsR family protein, partial [Bacteroidota bacterium]
YESLFSRRARKYASMGLKEKQLSETDYRDLILEEYTFLKRPVILIDDAIFVGNSKKVVAAAKAKLGL